MSYNKKHDSVYCNVATCYIRTHALHAHCNQCNFIWNISYYNADSEDHSLIETKYHVHCTFAGCNIPDFHQHCHIQGCQKIFFHAHCKVCNFASDEYNIEPAYGYHKELVHCKVAGCNEHYSHIHCNRGNNCTAVYKNGDYHRHCATPNCNRYDRHSHCAHCPQVYDDQLYHKHCLACDRTDKHKHCLKCKVVKENDDHKCKTVLELTKK